eukprot:Phypoly_transcript_01453.p1 GENE.Phypoly_transcript_01453~~Phypoly_transcript_01453.p1  ORF type:complete len:1056 (-),score=108.05 Phypoly_transcript_01453:168-3335(-)
MTPAQLQQLESLTEKAYTAQTQAERAHAEEALKIFSTPEYLPQCRFVLDNSHSDYATLFAASSMMKILTNAWNNFSVGDRIDVRNYLLNALASRGPAISQYLCTMLIQILARVTKFAWFDDASHQEITDSVAKFLEATVPHVIIGLKILNELINEMNTSTGGHLTLTQHRKIAISFRDKALLRIFQISLTSLKQVVAPSNMDAIDRDKIKDQALKLALQCLSFDFIGITPDESAEDLGIVQIPATWRSIFEDTGTLTLFLELYRTSVPPQSTQTMECLVQLASVRRSLFVNEDDRSVYLTQLIHGIRDILKNSTGLNESSNHHGFCRLLARLKSNYQLSHIIAVDCYAEWISLAADFTIKSIQSWEWSPNSVHYLLSLWSKLVSSLAFLKGSPPSLLDNYAPQITEAYVHSRMESVKKAAKTDDDDDTFPDDDRMSETLEVLPYLGRCKYPITSTYLVSLFDPLAASLTAEPTTSPNLPVIEGQLTWLVYIIGAILGGRGAISSSEEHDLIDGELAARVFQLMSLNDAVINQTQSHSASKVKLELALLYFIQSFRKVYIGDQSMSSSKVYKRLSDLLGIANHSVVLKHLLSKITTNLKYWAAETVIIEKTLNLFHDLAGGYSSGKLIVKLEITNQILQHSASQYFNFLEIGSNTRNRTTFYTTLGKLLFMEDNITKFDEFMVPFDKTFATLLSLNSVEAFRQETIKKMVIGLFRDLRGLTSSINSRRAYNMFFDWIYPKYMPVLHKVSEAWYDTNEATTPLLKFVAEFVLNKSGRLTFDCSSPNGILLFRETSQILVTYGSRILNKPITRDAYEEKYKGMALCLIILQRALCGNYVNFGVFALYGDMALSNALGIALKLALSFPLEEMLAFPKMAKAYFSFLDVLCGNHPSSVMELETPVFTQLVISMQEGLKSLDTVICTQSCTALDHLISAIYHQGRKDTPTSRALQKHMATHPELFPRILEYLLRVILFEDCANQASIARPMLGLILTHTKYFQDLKNNIVASQPVYRRERLGNVFHKLMDDVQDNLEQKNRDKFTTNMTMFRHEVKSFVTT